MVRLRVDNPTVDWTRACDRCGQQYLYQTYLAQVRRNSAVGLCGDCSGARIPLPKDCLIWRKDFCLDSMQPLKDGLPYREGLRVCGFRDCVKLGHIVPMSNDRANFFYAAGFDLRKIFEL